MKAMYLGATQHNTNYLGGEAMPFYVLTHESKGLYLSMYDNGWTRSLRFAKVFTSKTVARMAIRPEWQSWCTVQRIPRLPDRIPRGVEQRRSRGSGAHNLRR